MSLINLKQLQLFFSAVGQKVKSSRGNWNQNDPTADDYIKNRPFYEDKNGIHKIDEKYLPDVDVVYFIDVEATSILTSAVRKSLTDEDTQQIQNNLMNVRVRVKDVDSGDVFILEPNIKDGPYLFSHFTYLTGNHLGMICLLQAGIITADTLSVQVYCQNLNDIVNGAYLADYLTNNDYITVEWMDASIQSALSNAGGKERIDVEFDELGHATSLSEEDYEKIYSNGMNVELRINSWTSLDDFSIRVYNFAYQRARRVTYLALYEDPDSSTLIAESICVDTSMKSAELKSLNIGILNNSAQGE